MELLRLLTGDEPRKDKVRKQYTRGATLDFFVNGFDDADARAHGALAGIEAGSWLHGVLEVRLPQLPEDLVAFAKIKIKSKYLLQVEHTEHLEDADGNSTTRTSHSREKEQWLHGKTKVALSPLAVPDGPDEAGMYLLRYPFSYKVHSELCDSFASGHFMCAYVIRVKLKFHSPEFELKSKYRDIDVMARRPTVEDLSRVQPELRDTNLSLAGGDVACACALDAYCFLEGTQAVFAATVTNGMDRRLMSAKVELQEVITNAELHTSDRGAKSWGATSRDRVLAAVRLRGMEIAGGGATTRVKFAIDLPERVEPPTSGFTSGHHMCEVRHMLKLRLDVPWGADIRMRFPVRIVPDPARYRASPPLIAELPAVEVDVPVAYGVLDPVPVETPAWQPFVPRMLVFEVVGAEDLPKMDYTFGGLRGGADPYVTTWVNHLHVRSTRVVSDTRNPSFNETYRVYFGADEDISGPISLRFICYDKDRGPSKDDLIGRGELELDIDALPEFGAELEVPLVREDAKKPERGVLHIRILALQL